MSDKFRTFLRRVSPLIAVQAFLLGINLVTSIGSGSFYPWALYPIMAMGIPQFIIFTQTMLGDDHKSRTRQETIAQTAQQQTIRTTQTTQTQSAAPIDPSLAEHVAQVRAYKQEIERIAKTATPNTMNSTRLNELAEQFGQWTKQVELMAERVTNLRRNPLIMQDLTAVPVAIKKLETNLATEQDSRVRDQVERTLAARRSQLEALRKLENTKRHAETQLELTVASLGTIYSQALAGQSTNQIADYSHLAREVNEQVSDLRDQLDALEEVRLGNAQKNVG
jgi:hypothetical protein